MFTKQNYRNVVQRYFRAPFKKLKSIHSTWKMEPQLEPLDDTWKERWKLLWGTQMFLVENSEMKLPGFEISRELRKQP